MAGDGTDGGRSTLRVRLDGTALTVSDGMRVDAHDVPEMLYHYTSLDSLALILRNRTLRLRPLTSMDDKQEPLARDLDNLGRSFFASCWTDDPTESIPMWNMYAGLSSGVRIGLPPNPFAWHLVDTRAMAAIAGIPDPVVTAPYVKSLIRPEDLESGLFSTQTGLDSILYKVAYTDDRERLLPRVKRGEGEYDLLEFGIAKHTAWEFQREWRYLLWIVPIGPLCAERPAAERIREAVELMVTGRLEVPCTHYDLDLSPWSLSEMEVVPSPEMSPGNRLLLDLLVERHCPEARIVESALAETV